MSNVGCTFLDLCSRLTFHVLDQLNIRDAHVRANLATALVRLSPDRHDSADGQGHSVDPGQRILRDLFGLGE